MGEWVNVDDSEGSGKALFRYLFDFLSLLFCAEAAARDSSKEEVNSGVAERLSIVGME